MTTLYGSDFEGGHASRDGTAPNGATTAVPLYRHEVSLDYARVELELQYALSESWALALRVPWERKTQHASIAAVEPATTSEVAEMQRNSDIHHRDGTFQGIGDLMLLGRRHWGNFRIAAGFSVPTGKTVEDPYLLGEQGREHLHIQFGSGTFDPLLEASYARPLNDRFTAGGYLATRLPFYENRRTFQAPPEASAGVSLSHRTTENLRLRVEAGADAQGYGRWNGVRDPNTGLIATSVGAGATVRLRSLTVSADVRHPLSQRTLEEGDAFSQGPTFAVTVAAPLPRISSAR